eukprot:TRINITY_DN1046_c0_g4_i1.p1 TRINITY_DN1046_c0_g4~~TRINITY_DN1046_c0_g4_i1.p1  ORF type:complete len:881 (+),score=254.35 TRINITY_DN1046_c0_g4_i1:755-3397(+)
METLFKVLNNIYTHPGEAKYTTLKVHNPAVHQKIGRHAPALRILKYAGFAEDASSGVEVFQFTARAVPKKLMEALKEAVDDARMIEEALRASNQEPAEPARPAAATASHADPMLRGASQSAAAPAEWRPWTGQGAGVVAAGGESDGRPLFLGRGRDGTAGKCGEHLGATVAVVSEGNKEEPRRGDVLCLPSSGVRWVRRTARLIPEHAVEIGTWRGGPVYAARAHHERGIHPGFIGAHFGHCIIPWGGGGTECSNYEVLVCEGGVRDDAGEAVPPTCGALLSHAELMSFSASAVPRALIPKPLPASPSCVYVKARGTRVLACHDMAGNYTKADVSPYPVREDGADGLYRLRHWDVVETFVYFSHNFISIPTFGWVAAAHRHGRKVLGTFLAEHSNANLMQVLADGGSIRAAVAKLVEIQGAYNFDGWLINVEVPLDEMSASKLRGFVDQLTRACKALSPQAEVIWYDSVLETGPLKYQNELNHGNKAYFDVCDGFFTNYWWKPRSIANSKAVAGPRAADVYHGVDMFGRGTYGGGQYDSHKAVRETAPNGVSTALFAPGFSYENCGGGGRAVFEASDDRLWSGIREHYDVSATISALPFFTPFTAGCGRMMFQNGAVVSPAPWFDLASTFPSPVVPLKAIGGGAVESSLTYEDGFEGGAALRVATEHPMGLVEFFALGGEAANCSGGVSLELVLRGATVGFMLSSATGRYVLHPAESGDEKSSAQLQNVYCTITALRNGWVRYRWSVSAANLTQIALVVMKGDATIGRFAITRGAFPTQYSETRIQTPRVTVAKSLLTIEMGFSGAQEVSHVDVLRTDGAHHERWVTRTHNGSIAIRPNGITSCRLEGVDAAGQPLRPVLLKWTGGLGPQDVEVIVEDAQ